MTNVYITIDTEYSAGLYTRLGKVGQQENFDRSIWGKTKDGDVGIGYQIEQFDRYGIKAVFFVDPMPALIWGPGAISDIVEPILKHGHDVQLHLHSEWLQHAGDANPLGHKVGQNIKDFSRDEQSQLIGTAKDILTAAGAEKPVAFRAGNYGANDDTLMALHNLGIMYDSSHCPGIVGSACEISLSSTQRAPIKHCGVIEIPIGSIGSVGNGQRHAQITALSDSEMMAAVCHARDLGAAQFTLVSHSFELMSRDRTRTNKIVKHRFENFCKMLAQTPGVNAATYRDQPPVVLEQDIDVPVMPHNVMRTGIRLVEQLLSNQLYGAK